MASAAGDTARGTRSGGACGNRGNRDTRRRMSRPLLAVLVAVPLAWQACGALADLWQRLREQTKVPWSLRLAADDETRLRHTLGADAELVLGVRAASAPGSVLIVRQVTGDLGKLTPEQFGVLNAKNGLILQLVTLTYPQPWVIAVPDPVPLVEQLTVQGRDVRLGVLTGDPEPVAAPGWSRDTTHPRFTTWRFRKG